MYVKSQELTNDPKERKEQLCEKDIRRCITREAAREEYDCGGTERNHSLSAHVHHAYQLLIYIFIHHSDVKKSSECPSVVLICKGSSISLE